MSVEFGEPFMCRGGLLQFLDGSFSANLCCGTLLDVKT